MDAGSKHKKRHRPLSDEATPKKKRKHLSLVVSFPEQNKEEELVQSKKSTINESSDSEVEELRALVSGARGVAFEDVAAKGWTKLKSDKYKGSRWTKEEDEKLDIALKSAIKSRGLKFDESIKELISGQVRNAGTYRGIWEEVSAAIPRRSVESCYDHARTRYSETDKGQQWTRDEIARLKTLVARHGHDWRLISEKMDRLRVACRDKYRALQLEEEGTLQKGTWSLEEEEELRTLVCKYKDENTGKIPWQQISDVMRTRTALQCYEKYRGAKNPNNFNLDVRPFVLWSRNDEIRLLNVLWESGCEDESELNWQRTSEHPKFQQKWTSFQLMVQWKALKKRLSDPDRLDFDEKIVQLSRQSQEHWKVKKESARKFRSELKLAELSESESD